MLIEQAIPQEKIDAQKMLDEAKARFNGKVQKLDIVTGKDPVMHKLGKDESLKRASRAQSQAFRDKVAKNQSEIVRLYHESNATSFIARHLKVSISVVETVLREHGLDLHANFGGRNAMKSRAAKAKREAAQ